MQMNHLHLHVRDLGAARAFYERWFGFREFTTHGPILFLRDAGGLDLALAPDTDPAALPSWFHFGFRLDTPDDVRALRAEMAAAEVPLGDVYVDDPDFTCFRCQDPDGYQIEIYWE